MYNKSKIMKTAWQYTRSAIRFEQSLGREPSAQQRREIFAFSLKQAWESAKQSIAANAPRPAYVCPAPISAVEQMQVELISIQHKNRISNGDRDRVSQLRELIAA